MNQSQRMAPVGSDKELSDLLDFSMVSCPQCLPLLPGWRVLPKGEGCVPVGMRPPAPKSWDPPTGMVTPTKEMDPPTTSNGGTEPREEVSSLSSALLTAGAQCGCGGAGGLDYNQESDHQS